MKEIKAYDPRSEYSWVPAAMAIMAVTAKIIAYLIPYIAVFHAEKEKLEMLKNLQGDETFNAILIALVSFWAVKKSIDSNKQ